MSGRNNEFRSYESMPILGVPDVVVRERVDVHLEPVIVVDVHVGNEIRTMSHLYHCRPKHK